MSLSQPLGWAGLCLPVFLSSLLLGALLVGSPTVVEAQTCTRASQTVTGALATDCNTLLGLKDALAGTGSLNWAADTDMDTWQGITIEGDPARVTKLIIRWEWPTTLRGTIPQALGNLTGLTVLDLRGNYLTGTIPSQLGSLTKLTGLYLGENRLTGSIPTQLGNLTELTQLHLNDLRIGGTIPTQLGKLTKLTELHISSNRHYDWTTRSVVAITGKIPTELGSLTALTVLNLQDNELTGSIPSQLGSLTNLTDLRLSRNQLDGSIPTELGNLTSLTTMLDLHDNQLSGSIPTELGSLTSLTDLRLSSNQLSGSIPTELGSLTALTQLDLGNNQLTGSIPSQLGSLTNLTQLHLSDNNFTAGAFPSWISELTNLWTLGLSSTQRTGSIAATQFDGLTNLTTLRLSNNQLTGSIPTKLKNRTSLAELYLNGNQFSGTIPKGLESLRNLYVIDLSDNQLTGSIPAWASTLGQRDFFGIRLNLSDNQLSGTITDLSALKVYALNLSNNNFTAGDFPTWITNETSLKALYLSNVNLTGAFPTLTSLTKLSHLYLSDNSLTGSITDLSSLPLQYLDLSNNDFDDGAVPSWIADETSLWGLYLSNVNFTGTFPTLSKLIYLNELDLSDNNFDAGAIPDLSKLRWLYTFNLSNTNRTGAIPTALGQYQTWIYFDLSHNQLSGNIPSALGDDLPSLAYLDLSHNQLDGNIPTGIGDSPLLETLDLSHNELEGSIPSGVGTSPVLHTLDLSHNELTGAMPSGSGLPGIVTLNLSHNQLDGSIPSAFGNSTALHTFNLSHNKFTGAIASTFGNSASLVELDLSHNQLNGTVPPLGSLPKLEVLNLGDNQLSGTIPAVSGLTTLKTLNLGGNQLSGTIPAVNALTKLETLSFGNNPFTAGAFPTVSALTKLETLDLGNTNRTGTFPTVSALTKLKYLDLSNNAFTAGNFPTVSALTALEWFDLSSTNRTGTFPTLSALTKLTHLDLSDNAFTASAIPSWVNTALTDLEYLDLGNTKRNGAFPTLSDLDKLKHLDLSDNTFTAGNFPDLSDLTKLEYLWLANTGRTGAFPTLTAATLPNRANMKVFDISDNTFTPAGVIPSEITNMTELHTLRLRSTNRNGAIPDLSALTKLRVLDLSDNDFTQGPIPSWLTKTNFPGLEFLYLSKTKRDKTIPSALGNLPLVHLFLDNNLLTGSLPSNLSNKTGLVLRVGGNDITGIATGIVVAKTDDTLSSGFTFHATSNPCGSTTATDIPDDPSLRDAMIWANKTSESIIITFATSLDGETIDLSNPLPTLCSGQTATYGGNGNLTLDGDIDGDGSPDITLDGDSLSTGAVLTVRSSKNTINGLTITGGDYGIVVQADDGTTAGAISNTTLRGNTISETDEAGIAVLTKVAGSTISTTTIEQNEVYENDGHGIAAWSEAVNTTRTNSITGLTIRDNHVHDHDKGAGIRVVSGLCEGDYNRIQATISGNTLSENGKADTDDAHADIEAGAASTDGCTSAPTDTTGNHLDVTIEDNVSEDAPHVGIAVTGGVNESDTNTVTATVARNTVRRSATAGIQVVGGTNSSDSNTVTATLNDNLITRLTKPASNGNAGHGLALLAAAADPNTSTSGSNTLTVSGRGNVISIQRNTSDTTGYDLYLQENNNTANPTRTGNTLTDSLTNTIFTPGCEDRNPSQCQKDDRTQTPTPVPSLTPVTIPDNHAQVDDYTFTPVSGTSVPNNPGLPSNTQFSAGGQVFDITVLDSNDKEVTDSLTESVTVCLPIPAGVSPSQAYVMRYNRDTHTWDRLTKGRTTTGGQVCASVDQFSLFRLGVYGSGGGGTTDGGGGGGGGRRAEPAVLHNRFERPVDGAVVSGIGLIAGWSFAEAAEVEIATVTLYVDRRQFAVIPCCAIRPDVAAHPPHAAFPPANTGHSGWGMIQNWGNLPAGPHTIEVVVTSSDGGEWRSPRHRITVLTPGDIAFADWGSLAEAAVRLDGEELVLDGVVLRDKETQEEHELTLRYAWQTLAQGFQLVASRPLTTARAQPPGLPALLARVGQWATAWLSPAGVTASTGIRAVYEVPADQAAVAGIGLIGGWAFPLDPTDKIATVTVEIGAGRRESAPCCATRPDVAENYPAATQAGRSGWGLVFNYGHLTAGEHDLTAHIETEAGVAYEKTHTVRVARLGGFAYVDRFDLSAAEVDLVGEEIILSGVKVRDKESQAWATIDVRVQWSAATQGLVIVDSETVP